MKLSTLISTPILASSLLFLSGCASFESRTDEKSYVFDSLSPETKQRLKEGEIRVGDSTDMVYIALGDPSAKREVRNGDGTETRWVYSSYSRQYDGDVIVGYQRTVRKRGLLGGYTVTTEPVSQSTYRDRVDENYVVTFRGGRVVEIETNA